MHNQRTEKVYTILSEHNLDAILVSKPENIHYLSGFTGTSGMLVIAPDKKILITDFRYMEQATRQASDFEIIKQGTDAWVTLQDVLTPIEVKTLGVETDFVTYESYSTMNKDLDGIGLQPVKLDILRMVKDTTEIELISKACDIADQAFEAILHYIRPGITEAEIAFEIEFCMRRLGAEKTAFDTIVASGNRSSLPHGVASDKVVEHGDFITMDFGAVYQGYHSDITRTVVLGKATQKQREVYELVHRAQMAGLAAVRPGVSGKSVDAVARNIIKDAGYGKYFGHGLGHGVGLVIHEAPRLSPVMGMTVLKENMLVTVEPGVYLPEWGGVRIEDTVLVTDTGSKPLTSSSKKLIELD